MCNCRRRIGSPPSRAARIWRSGGSDPSLQFLLGVVLPPDKGRPSNFSTRGFLLHEFLLRQSGVRSIRITIINSLHKYFQGSGSPRHNHFDRQRPVKTPLLRKESRGLRSNIPNHIIRRGVCGMRSNVQSRKMNPELGALNSQGASRAEARTSHHSPI